MEKCPVSPRFPGLTLTLQPYLTPMYMHEPGEGGAEGEGEADSLLSTERDAALSLRTLTS